MRLMVLRSNTKRTWFTVVALLLCFCVVMQMLGVPLTMWNPWDNLSTSENWDFSIPSITPRLYLSILLTPFEMSQTNLHPPLLPHTLFHPPKSPQ